jgi:Ni/Co efflux regulator RcnB
MKRLPRAVLALLLTVLSMAAAPAVLLALPAVARAQPQVQAKGHALPRRGDYLPADLIKAGPNVDAAAQHLRRPPSGYGWFSLAGVFVLASLSNGLIVEVAAP